jgi:hypothetical protein
VDADRFDFKLHSDVLNAFLADNQLRTGPAMNRVTASGFAFAAAEVSPGGRGVRSFFDEEVQVARESCRRQDVSSSFQRFG